MSQNKKILIMGAPASGKTYLAKYLAKKEGIVHIEVDRYYWKGIKGKELNALFKSRLTAAIHAQDNYIIEGQFKKCFDLIAPEVTHVVFLKPHFLKLSFRTFKRLVQTQNLTEFKMNFSKNAFKTREHLYQQLLENGVQAMTVETLKQELAC